MSLHSLDSQTNRQIGSVLQAGSKFVFVPNCNYFLSSEHAIDVAHGRRLNWTDEPCPPQDRAVNVVPPKISELFSLAFSDLSGTCK